MHHKVKAVVCQDFASADGTARQGTEIVPQTAGETEHIQLFFDLFAHFRDVLSMPLSSCIGEQQMTDRTKMYGGDERGETASLFGQKPQVLLGLLEIN